MRPDDSSPEYSGLNWVKKELDAVLNQARLALEAYIEDPGQSEPLVECMEHLRQVHGTLQMVELYGAAMLTEEMQAVVRAVRDGAVKEANDAFEVLMRAMLQLPDYLEHIQAGHRDIPIVLLPLLNDLRAARGAGLLSENVLFFPDLASAPQIGVQAEGGEEDVGALARKLRHSYQLALLGWLRERDVRANLMKLLAVSSRLAKACEPGPTRNFWWIVAAVLESLALGGVKPNTTLKQLVGKTERLMKQMAANDQQAFAKLIPAELIRNLLFYVASAPPKGEYVLAVKDAYRLDRLLPEGDALEQARESLMGGANLELLNTVSQAIRDELAEVKDSIELFVHAGRRQAADLAPLGEKLHRIADTIGMLGLGEPRELVLDQAAAVGAMVEGKVEADENALLDVAGAMLKAESLIDDFVAAHGGAGLGVGGREAGRLSDAEYREVVVAAIREILTDLNKAKESILEYVAEPQDTSVLTQTPEYLARIRGALGMLPLERLAPVLDGIRGFLVEQVLDKGRRPAQAELEALADAITSVEFYLESIVDDRGGHDKILEVGHASLAKLGYPVGETAAPSPVGEPEEAPVQPGGDGDQAAGDEADGGGQPTAQFTAPDSTSVEGAQAASGAILHDESTEPTVESSSLAGAARQAAPASDGASSQPPTSPRPAAQPADLKPLAGEVDEEILEIFLEEAGEEIERINEYLPKWEADQDDEDALTTVRRSFHTLKGSGRLVGAQLLGEFAWYHENLLNRVIDKTIPPAPHIFEALHKAVQVLPELVAQIRGEGAPSMDVYALMRQAEAMSRPDYAETLGAAEQEESEVDRNAFIEAAEEVEAAVLPEPEAPPENDATAERALEPMASVPAVDELEELEEAPDEDAGGIEIDLERPGPQPEPQPRIDPVLYGIFKTEAEQHLATLEDYLAQDLEGREGLAPTKELIRALHTLNGAARTADVPEMSRVFSVLEHYAKTREQEALVLPKKALDLLAEAVAHARAVLEALRDVDRSVPDGVDLAARIEQLSKADLMAAEGREAPRAAAPPPAASPGEPDLPGEQDMELVDIFLEEAAEIMDASDNTLARLEADPGDRSAVTEFQRQLHTLKGGARMAGFKNIGNLSHAVESLMIGVVEGRVELGSAVFAQLHQAMDRLNAMLESARRAEPVQPAPELLAALEALRQGGEPQAPGASSEVVAPEPSAPEQAEPAQPPHGQQDTPARAEPVAEEEPAAEPEPVAVQGPVAEAEVGAEIVPLERAREERRAAAQAPRSSPQELVRVRSDLLDSLVNYAGEVNIYHSRLEQQITGFRFNLNELSQTVQRLREQLRKLELETEAQIRFSYEKERGPEDSHDEDFDPLELDRYSTIQQLSRALAESLNDLVSIEEFLSEQVRDAETLLLQQSRVSTDLQEGLMRTRMVQFTGMVPRLRRVVRQTAQELGKKVELDIVGESSELDRSVLERMTAPLEHMLRNAIAHGIEAPERRRACGKDEVGKVRIEVGREGSEVVIRVSDDGAGVDLEAVREKARRLGLISANDALSDSDVMQFILESGFSTAKEVSQISGRGVGLDVVNNEIKQLNGVLRIDSVKGKGTTFTVRLPFTLAINQALLVQAGEDLFAIPLSSIEGIVRAGAQELRHKYAMDVPVIEYAANTYELKHLGSLLGVGRPQLGDAAALFPVLLVRSGDQRIALQVEGLLGSREVVVKPVGPQISKARGISGATILGDGRVVLILDVPALVRMGVGLRTVYSAETSVAEQPAAAQNEQAPRALTVMVVDDSITIRKVTARMLERNDFQVMTAKDGVDAVAQLQEQVPDLMLLDIEMPRMDGFELAQHVRNDERLRSVPIIMITSRTGEKHRQRALDIGVNRYLGKPYQESDLLENIHELLKDAGKL